MQRASPEPTCALTRRVFVVLLGLVSACAFVSLGVQHSGLLGSRGIAPAAELLERVRAAHGGAAWSRLPTLFWLGAGDSILAAAWGLGALLSLLPVLGLAPRYALLGAWALYLSFVSVGDPFLAFQWDSLLLEALLLGALWAPGGLRPSWRARPGAIGRFLVLWLLFRVLFLSGVVKLASGDASWRDLTALEYHFWTQPLPGPVSAFAASWPTGLQRVSAAGMFAVELIAPFGLFGPRRVRRISALAVAALLLGIVTTGNYGFFEPLCLVLCVAAFDDRDLARLVPRRFAFEPEPLDAGADASLVVRALVCVLVLLLTASAGLRRLNVLPAVQRAVLPLARVVAPFRSFNAYGLFAVMTTERPELEVEVSPDGTAWSPLVFAYKPGPLARRPPLTGLHMPRLDWQMWFAALGAPQQAGWFAGFATRVLEGEPAVLALLEDECALAAAPPRFVRVSAWLYTFTPAHQRRLAGEWWQREFAGTWLPPLELDEAGRLRQAR